MGDRQARVYDAFMMRHTPRSIPALRRLLGLAVLSLLTTGCASLVEQGVRSLVGDGAPGSASRPSAVRSGAGKSPVVASRYQHAPTHDWKLAQGAPFTPAHSIFGQVSPGWLRCKPVPVGLAQVFSGPTGPAASPLVSLGPAGLYLGGPDGVVSDAFATDSEIVAVRALLSGARMAGYGPTCGNRFHLFMLIGGQPDQISVLR